MAWFESIGMGSSIINLLCDESISLRRVHAGCLPRVSGEGPNAGPSSAVNFPCKRSSEDKLNVWQLPVLVGVILLVEHRIPVIIPSHSSGVQGLWFAVG